jgi:hypothetical protein
MFLIANGWSASFMYYSDLPLSTIRSLGAQVAKRKEQNDKIVASLIATYDHSRAR